METVSALLAICAGNSPLRCEFPTQRQVTRSFDVFIDLRLNKPLSKQSWGWWFETLSRPLWRQCNVVLGPSVTLCQCNLYFARWLEKFCLGPFRCARNMPDCLTCQAYFAKQRLVSLRQILPRNGLYAWYLSDRGKRKIYSWTLNQGLISRTNSQICQRWLWIDSWRRLDLRFLLATCPHWHSGSDNGLVHKEPYN